jgi:hypothetical protein
MRSVLPILVSTVAPLVIRLYFLTIRILDDARSERERRGGKLPPAIYAFWHAHQLACAWHYRHVRAAVLVSEHRDGEYIARAIRSFGLEAVRGSSTRGGTKALMALMEKALQGRSLAITPDGPRGPRHHVKDGLLYLAQKTGLPVQPVAVGLSDYWELRSWDRFRIPKPFARGYAMLGEPIPVPGQMNEEGQTALRRRIEGALNALEQAADERACQLKYGRRA